MASHFPLSSQNITAALHDRGLLPDGVDVTLVSAERVGVELGFNGELWRIELTYPADLPEVPSSLVVKLSADESVDEKLDSEARFYRELAGDIGIRIPRAYGIGSRALLLEDLSDFRCGDVVAGCSADETLRFVRQLARLHATWWNSPKLTALDWLPRWPNSVERFCERFRTYHPVFLDRFAAVPDPVRQLTVKLVDRMPNVLRELSQVTPTLMHVDTHLDNVLFGPEEQVVLIDWPSAAIGPGVFDYVRFVSTSITTDVRRSLGDGAMEAWRTSLIDDGVRERDLGDLQHIACLTALRIWAGMVTGYGASNPDELLSRQRKLQSIEAERMVALLQDWQPDV